MEVFNCLLKRWLLAFFSVNGSRGSVIDKAEDLQKISEGFGVFGNYKEAESQEFGSNWFNNVKVTYSSQDIKWTYSPVKYWLPQGHIDFLAYATNQTKDNISSTNNKVKFQFAHALSRLGYTVADKLYVIVEYTIKDYNGVTTPMKNTVYQKLEKNFEQGKAYTLNLTLVKEKSKRVIYTWTPPDTEDGGVLKLTASQLDHTCAKIENDPNSSLYVIPQEKKEAFYLQITYTVQQGTSLNTVKVKKNLLDVNNPFNFEKRKTYLLHLKLSLGSTRSRSSASEDCSVTMSVSSIPE
nr:hypothetical protein [uncultured Prevotella sp.]